MSTTTVSASKMFVEKPKITIIETQKKKSWALMAIESDEEELLEMEDEKREKMRKIVHERRYLLSIGHYELEEGEILE